MRNALLSLAAAAAGGYFYLHQPQPVATTLPEGHHHAPDGVYYLRTACSISSSSGPVQWASGQMLYEDRRVQETPNSGMVIVSDGTHTAQLLPSMLSQDVEEGTGLRSAAAVAEVNTRALANQERFRTEMQARLAPPAASYVSPLEQSTQRIGTMYYNPGYSSVVVREVRPPSTSASQAHDQPRPVVVIPPRPVIVTH